MPHARYHYSAYWDTWSLVLSTSCKIKPGSGKYVEIDLTAINGWQSTHADKTLAINVRRHGTMRGHNDRDVAELPAQIIIEMRQNFGEELTNWLLDPATEILGKINWEKLCHLSNGGASLYEIVHEQYLEQIPQKPLPTKLAA